MGKQYLQFSWAPRHGVYYQNRHHLLEKGWKRDIKANRTKKQAAVAT